MILYFSATGNCKYVARRIADKYGDESVDILDCIREERFVFNEEVIGLITPVYFWALPVIVKDFLLKAEFHASYLFFIATFGTTPGASDYYAKKFSGSNFDAYYSIRMADSYTPMFDISTPEKLQHFTKTTEKEIDEVIGHLASKDRGQFMRRRMPVLFAHFAYLTYEDARKTKHLSANEKCIGCGLCAKGCPLGAIEMRDKKPVWTKEKCAMCLRCLHRCPAFCIHYNGGNKTKKNGQYTNPHVKI